MKKILSVVLSLVMLFSVGAISVNAFAAVGSVEETKGAIEIVTEVNGKPSDDITHATDPDEPRKMTFTYKGDGELIGWEFPGMVEGTDYTIVSEDGNAITILVADAYAGEVIASAIVNEEEEEEETTKKETTTKATTVKSESTKSPKTGAAASAGLLAMGAGAAILTALKKKEDAE